MLSVNGDLVTAGIPAGLLEAPQELAADSLPPMAIARQQLAQMSDACPDATHSRPNDPPFEISCGEPDLPLRPFHGRVVALRVVPLLPCSVEKCVEILFEVGVLNRFVFNA